MTAITINASRRSYIRIDPGIRHTIGQLLVASGRSGRAAIVSDSRVAALYLREVRKSLLTAGFMVTEFVFPEGENSKNLTNYAALLSHLAQSGFSRSDTVLALGGGVTGDLAGFAAATYLRGTGLVQIPTTLLAAVDSSVGGKTAVNLPEGKNLVGCVYQPHLVAIDPQCLQTLSGRQFSCGMAEILKYGMLGDKDLFDAAADSTPDTQSLIARCVQMKASFVEKDEEDEGERQLLNLGHTVGHAVEKLSGFTIPHGEAVAIGMAAIARAAWKNGWSDEDCAAPLKRALEKNRLPVACPFGAKELHGAILSDKKRRGDAISLVVPRRIGSAYRKTVPLDALERILQDGLDDAVEERV